MKEGDLEALCARGRAGNPSLLLDDETFVRQLARVAGDGSSGAALAALAVEDLYLAGACLAQTPGAAAELRSRHGGVLRAAIVRIVAGADADEVEQQFLDGLLVGTMDSPPKIGSFAGQAPLGRWLQVGAQRAALMWIRGNQAETRARRGAAAEPRSGVTHPETAYLKERYRHDFEHALKEALDRASERERALLRLHLVSGLSVEKIGKMFGVSQPTASRWLAQARSTLLAHIKAMLRERLGTSSSGEMAKLAGLVASRLDLSLSQVLKPR